MKRLILILCVSMGLLLSSCYKDIISPGKNPNAPPEFVSFSGDVVPIFAKNCALSGCHAVGGHNPILAPSSAYTALTSGGYINATLPTNSAVYTVAKPGGKMPTLNSNDLQKLLDWIRNGAPNN